MARIKVEVPVQPEATGPQQTPVHQGGENHGPAPKSNSLPYKKFFLLAAIVFGILFVSGLYQERNRLREEVNQNKSGVQTGDVDQIVTELSKTIELPTSETPQMRTIENAATFKEQSPVFSDINDGDVWLFYPKSGKQVFYRPSTKKVIFVVPLVQSVDGSDTTQ